MKRNIEKIVLYLIGIMLIFYPLVSKYIAFVNQTEVVQEYKVEVAEMTDEDKDNLLNNTENFNTTNSEEIRVINPNTIEEEQNITSTFDFLQTGQIIGYVSIPKIHVELAIYEGVTNDNLQLGLAHLENTSLPNGQVNTCSVLAGHTGIPNKVLLDNLNDLEVGDEFYITYLNEVSKYVVESKRVVLPDDTESLRANEEECRVVLVTCTPKSINTHRLLVNGVKVENSVVQDEEGNEMVEEIVVPEIEMTKTELFKAFIQKNIELIRIVIVVFIVFLIFILIDFRKTNKK